MNLFIAAALFFRLLCNVAIGLLFARMVLSWISVMGNETILRLYEGIAVITDPLLAPARAILSRFQGLENLPIDLSPLVTILLLSIINIVLFGG